MKSEFGMLLACMAVMLGAQLAIAAKAEEPVRKVLIGFAAPLSQGPSQSGRDAAQLAIREISAKPVKIAGSKVVFELLEQNDKADANIAVISARYFVASKVVAVVGHWNAATSLATAKIYSDAGIAQVSPSTTAIRFTQLGYQTTFRMVGHDGMRASHIADYAVSTLSASRIAVLDDGTVFGTAIADQVASFVHKTGGIVSSRISITNKTSDFMPALDNIRQTKTDLMFHAGALYSGYLDHGSDLISGIKRIGFPKKVILGEATVDPDMLKDASDMEVFAIAPGFPMEKLPRWKTFEKNYRVHFNTRITPYSPPAYDAIYAIVNAIKLADSLDPPAIVSALHKVRFAGLTGVIAFDEKGDLITPGFTVYQIKQGAWTAIKTIGQ